VLLVVTGAAAREANAAADLLAARGVRAGLMVVASLQPAPVDDLAEALAQVQLVLTVEAHYASGGLGSLVAEVSAERGLPCRVVRCAVRAQPDGRSGSQAYLYARHGLSAESLAEQVMTALGAGGR
jgi:transketolase